MVNKDDLPEIYRNRNRQDPSSWTKWKWNRAKGGKENLVITEIPYTMMGANIGKFLNDMADLVRVQEDHRYRGYFQPVFQRRYPYCTGTAQECRCRSNLINMLYKKTRLEDTFGVNMLAVAEGRPETLSLRRIIEHHIDFQFEVNTRKYQTLLR